MPAKKSREFSEAVEIRGHIIDSLILPKVLDAIMAAGGSFTIENIVVGQTRHDPSFARVVVAAPTAALLNQILATISDHGASPVTSQDCQLVSADLAGTFPEGFYSTTNQRTEVRMNGVWLDVHDQEMDCGIVVDTSRGEARCVAMTDVTLGQQLVVGHGGVRVTPEERQHSSHGFEFMNSAVSTEKPKGVATAQVAKQLHDARSAGQKILIVGGPAIVHTGSVEHLTWLIRNGYVQKLFAGNALAAHYIEQAMFGTSLGVQLHSGDIVEAGHEHHLRAINRIRRLGGIRKAVETSQLNSGIMYECVKHDVDFLLAGSIRDDGPLPEVITDTLEAQRQMRERVRDVSFCLMIATTLHSIAIGNLLPAWVRVVCVDINPSTVIKLSDRGSFQTVGLVTDVEPFLRALVADSRQADPMNAQARILMCPPDFYGIEYEINPWMHTERQTDHAVAKSQWNDLRQILMEYGAAIELLTPVAGLPDLVFTANAALIYHDRAICSRFRHQQRQGEEQHDAAWLAAHGFTVETLPDDHFFEGAGDALFCGDTLFAGYRMRSQAVSHQLVAARIGCRVIPMELVDPYYYHLDTCFCPLTVDIAAYYPGAFDDYGRQALRAYIPTLIEVDRDEAREFACNAVVIGSTITTNTGCPFFHEQLRAIGFTPIATPLGEFVKAGGSAKCLTLRLDGEDAASWRTQRAEGDA